MPDIIRELKKKETPMGFWAVHAWRKKETFVRLVQCGAHKGKKPLGRPRLRWDDRVKKDVKMVEPDSDWHVSAMGRTK